MHSPSKRGKVLRCRRGMWVACCSAVAVLPFARAREAPEPSPAAPAFKLFRFDEDYRYLEDPAKRIDAQDAIKYIPLGQSDWYLSLGGELRERFEFYSRPGLGLQGQGADGYLLQRVLFHADFHAGENFRTFVQIGSHLAPGKEAAAPPYLDRLDIQQAFVDVQLAPASDVKSDAIVRIGRQEMAFGSQRLVSIRDAPNVRRNFDGVRLSGAIEDRRLDAFLTRPVQLRRGAFDDPSDRTQAFWGLYAVNPIDVVAGSKLDLYYFGFKNDRARFAAGTGEERRQTVGARFFGASMGWDWDWEALGQFGTFRQQEIRAFGVSTDTGYTLNAVNQKVRVGLKADVGSGDRDASDSTVGTLNPLFPKLAYFNQAALLGPSNVIQLQPTLGFKPAQELGVNVGYGFLWRANTADAIYTGAGVPISGTAGLPGRFTARQFSIDLTWKPDRHVDINGGYVRLNPAEALRTAGGKSVDFIYLSAAYKF